MERPGSSSGHDPSAADGELALFAIEAVLLVSSIALVVHFRSTTAAVYAVGAILVAGILALVRVKGLSSPEPESRSARESRSLAVSRTRPRPGDYRATARALYRVEKVQDDRALIEDCRTGALVDIELGELDTLRVVPVAAARRAGSSSGSSARGTSAR
jgi:hypothetical protein